MRLQLKPQPYANVVGPDEAWCRRRSISPRSICNESQSPRLSDPTAPSALRATPVRPAQYNDGHAVVVLQKTRSQEKQRLASGRVCKSELPRFHGGDAACSIHTSGHSSSWRAQRAGRWCTVVRGVEPPWTVASFHHLRLAVAVARPQQCACAPMLVAVPARLLLPFSRRDCRLPSSEHRRSAIRGQLARGGRCSTTCWCAVSGLCTRTRCGCP